MRVTAGSIGDEEECVGKMLQFLFSSIKLCFALVFYVLMLEKKFLL